MLTTPKFEQIATKTLDLDRTGMEWNGTRARARPERNGTERNGTEGNGMPALTATAGACSVVPDPTDLGIANDYAASGRNLCFATDESPDRNS